MQDSDPALLRHDVSSTMRGECPPSSGAFPDRLVPDPPSRHIPPVNSNCFACGRHNPNGLHLTFEGGSHGVEATWIPNDTSESFQDTVHGGLITTVLDEAMSKAIMASGWQAFTVCISARFHSRISPGERLRVHGWIVERRKRRILTEASLINDSGIERAHARATFLMPGRSQTRKANA
jgi:acyl-coenzyme A thioesterase PaaI-like protein